MTLTPIGANFIDKAWREGAHVLADACKESGGEITGDQLKMLLSRGERTLFKMTDGDKLAGWGVARIDQLPNLRVLHITDLSASGGHFEKFFESIKVIATDLGCSRIRCAAKPAQERLYRIKCGFQPVYSILEVEV